MSDGAGADFYIAPGGCDQWSGTLPEPNPSGTDGPFAGLARARDAVRERMGAHRGGQVEVQLREGRYLLEETVVFGLEDSGGRDTRIVYAAYPGETPVFSSGVPVGPWRRLAPGPDALPPVAQGNVWVAPLPDGVNTVLTLYDGTRRLTRAHGEVFQSTGTTDYEPAASLNVAHERDRPLLRRVEFPPGALRDFENIEDIELRFTPVPWTMNVLPLESVNLDDGVATLAVEATAPPGARNRWGIRVENAMDHLDRPGRWVVNSRERRIYYWPDGDRPGDDIVAPCLQELIRVEGAIDAQGPEDRPVRGLVFRGLTLMHGERDRTNVDYKGWGIQHDWEMFDKGTALLRFRGAEDCTVDACRFTCTGGTGVRLDLHCQHIQVTRSLFDDIGCAGILLCGYGPGTKDVNHHNQITNNLLHHCGEVIWHGHGIFVWQSGENRIAHNRIHHCARKAIGLCGVRVPILEDRDHTFDEASRTIRWHEIDHAIAPGGDNFDRFMPFQHTRNNRVEDNEIFRVLEKLSDGSALNVSGAGEGNIIRRNFAHHIRTYNASSVMRVDDWQRGTVFRDNIVYCCNIGAITRKNLNHVVNNIFADVSAKGMVRFASYPDEAAAPGSRIQRNIFYDSGPDAVFYTTSYLVSPGASLPTHCNADYNLFYCAGDPAVSWQHVESCRSDGIEAHSLSADPLFVDAAHGDLRLSPDSPALRLGFEPIDTSRIGLLPDFPAALLALDVVEPEDEAGYARGRDESRKTYAWW